MAIQTLSREFWWPKYMDIMVSSLTSTSGATMNSSGDRWAVIVKIPKTGTLDAVHFGIKASSTQDLKVSFMDVDANGDPDDTIDEFRTFSLTSGDANTMVQTGLMTDTGADGGTKRSVTAGDLMAIVFEFNSYSTGSYQPAYWTVSSQQGIPYWITDSGGGWSTQAGSMPAIALEYNDGSFADLRHCIPVVAQTAFAADTADTPDELCMRFKVAGKMRVSGFFWRGGALDVEIELTTDADANVAGPLVATIQQSDIHSNMSYGYLTTPVEIDADTWYRLQWTPTHATNQANTRLWDFPSAAMLEAFGFTSSNYQVGTRVDSGSWTDLSTRLWTAGLIVNGIDDGAGGGGGGRGAGPFIMGGALNSGQQRFF